MGLKSIHEAKKLQNEPENSSDSQLIEEQYGLIGELQEEISELSSENSMLQSELQKKSETIRSLNEQIGKLSESDKVLKQNERLERQNARLESEKQDAIQRADIVVQNCKAEYERKLADVEQQKKQVERMEENAKMNMACQYVLIQRKAESISKEKIKTLENQYKAKLAGYEEVMMASLLYGTLCTLFTAAHSELFMKDCKVFFTAIWSFLQLCSEGVLQGAKWVSQIGKIIPQPDAASFVQGLIQVVAIVAVAGGVGFLLIACGSKKLYEGYKEHFVDQASLAELLISLAVVVFFAEPIRSFLPINLVFLLILIHVLYIGIRQYIKDWKRARGYY